jgi:hypothetical protein
VTLYDKLFLAAYFLTIIIVQCVWQARLFKRNKPISHAWHAVYYLLSIAPAVWMFWPSWWQVVVIGILTRLAFFDPLLNLIRGKPLLYNGAGTTGSKLDQFENKFSVTWIRFIKLGYVALFVIAIIKIR